LAGNLDVVREDSEGIWRQLQTLLRLCIMLLGMGWCGSLYWGPGLWGTFVSLCAFSRKCSYGATYDCMVVYSTNYINGLALDSVLCSQH